MKIVSKECPKCGANLKFNVGDRDVHCEKCRRDFAVEYDSSYEDAKAAINELGAEGAKLVGGMAGHINENMKMFKTVFFVVFGIAIITFIAIFIFGIVNAINIRNEFNQEWDRANSGTYMFRE